VPASVHRQPARPHGGPAAAACRHSQPTRTGVVRGAALTSKRLSWTRYKTILPRYRLQSDGLQVVAGKAGVCKFESPCSGSCSKNTVDPGRSSTWSGFGCADEDFTFSLCWERRLLATSRSAALIWISFSTDAFRLLLLTADHSAIFPARIGRCSGVQSARWSASDKQSAIRSHKPAPCDPGADNVVSRPASSPRRAQEVCCIEDRSMRCTAPGSRRDQSCKELSNLHVAKAAFTGADHGRHPAATA